MHPICSPVLSSVLPSLQLASERLYRSSVPLASPWQAPFSVRRFELRVWIHPRQTWHPLLWCVALPASPSLIRLAGCLAPAEVKAFLRGDSAVPLFGTLGVRALV